MTPIKTLIERVEAADLRCTTLWQPWATLFMLGFKPQETRSRPIPPHLVGKDVVIHSAASWPSSRHISDELHELCIDVLGCAYNYSLPMGKALGAVRLDGQAQMPDAQPLSDDDRVCGIWKPGRWAYGASDRRQFPTPIGAKGMQGWWRAGPEIVAAYSALLKALDARETAGGSHTDGGKA